MKQNFAERAIKILEQCELALDGGTGDRDLANVYATLAVALELRALRDELRRLQATVARSNYFR